RAGRSGRAVAFVGAARLRAATGLVRCALRAWPPWGGAALLAGAAGVAWGLGVTCALRAWHWGGAALPAGTAGVAWRLWVTPALARLAGSVATALARLAGSVGAALAFHEVLGLLGDVVDGLRLALELVLGEACRLVDPAADPVAVLAQRLLGLVGELAEVDHGVHFLSSPRQ